MSIISIHNLVFYQLKQILKMKKVSIILFVLFFVVMTKSVAQSATATTPIPVTATAETADFFAAKWELSIIGTPGGDKKMLATIVRKEGKLTGDLGDPAEPDKEKIAITSIEEEATKITLAFTTSGYDVTVDLEKVDDDNLKGQLMGMFETKAVRVK
jgi:hypothetical protein